MTEEKLDKKELTRLQKLIEQKLDEYIPLQYPETIHEAMRYSVLNGGKRLRGILCIESCKAFGKTEELALPMACSIEIIHAQSLIHDDLPCMDDDDYRRGKPSTHKKYGEAIAVLAGDALIPYAYEVFLKHTPETVSQEIKIQIIQEFSEIIGARGLVGGQVVDVYTEGQKISPETLDYIHSHKTGALYNFSLRSGAILSGCSQQELDIITEYSEALGLAFQISDDILDITGSKESLGKTPGKDEAKGKNTYPSIYGLDHSRNELSRLCNKAIELIETNNINSSALLQIAQFIANRV